jgi:hypothetical protein
MDRNSTLPIYARRARGWDVKPMTSAWTFLSWASSLAPKDKVGFSETNFCISESRLAFAVVRGIISAMKFGFESHESLIFAQGAWLYKNQRACAFSASCLDSLQLRNYQLVTRALSVHVNHGFTRLAPQVGIVNYSVCFRHGLYVTLSDAESP